MPSIAAVLKLETLSGLQHMELFIGEFFLRCLCYCITIDFYSTTSTTAGFTA